MSEDFREVGDDLPLTVDNTLEPKEPEKICFSCHRPESVTGSQVDMGNGVSVCRDCLKKSLDALESSENGADTVHAENASASKTSDAAGNGGFGDLASFFQNIPHMTLDLSSLSGIPGFAGLAAGNEAQEEDDDFEEGMTIKNVPPPHKIKAQMDRYIVGQERAKKVVSVAVYNHYKRILKNEKTGKKAKEKRQDRLNILDDSKISIEKSNILLIGPTGSGKTYMVQTLARLLDVPLAMTDATSLTEAGYIGDDIESVVSKLLAAAGNNVTKAERGIIFIDEIDKIAKKKNSSQRDVSGESVQQGMLKLLEGADVEVPVGASSKNAMVPMKTVDTRNILFICGGAFPSLEGIIKERLNKESSIGFHADLKDKYDEDPNLLMQATTEDLRNFGMIPEFLGRLPIICSLEDLTEDMLVRILGEPQNAILKQYQELLAMDEVKLTFEEEALRAIAKKAIAKKTGARALRSIIEDFMLDIMYEIPKDDNIGEVIITKDYVEHTGGPRILTRSQSLTVVE